MANVNEAKDASKIGTNIQFKRKVTTEAEKTLSGIDLAPGEPLLVKANNELRIGEGRSDDTDLVLSPSEIVVTPSAANGAVDIKHVEDNGAVKSSHNIKGTKGVSVTSDPSGNITIDSNYELSKNIVDNTVTLMLAGLHGGEDTTSSVEFIGSDNLSITEDSGNIKLSGTASIIIKDSFNELANAKQTAGKNSIGIVKELINTDEIDPDEQKYQHTAYVLDLVDGKKTWQAMDGNYSADTVYFPSDITITEDFGKYKKANKQLCPDFESTGNYTLPAGGKSLSNLISDVFSSETQGWTRIPECSFTVSDNSSGEVGTTYTLPTATFTVTDVGGYQYGPATGITYTVEVTAGEATATGSDLTDAEENNTVSVQYGLSSGLSPKYTDVSITHEMSYEYSHTAGATPNTNITPKTITTTPIAAKENQTGSLSTTFTGYRKSFYVLNKTDTDISQTSKISGSVWSQSKPTSISVLAQSTSLLICVPGADISSVTATDDLAMNSPVTLTAMGNKTLAYNSSGTQTDGYTYSVFQVVWDEPLATAKRLKLTW